METNKSWESLQEELGFSRRTVEFTRRASFFCGLIRAGKVYKKS